MSLPHDLTLPFFAYGVFQPGELAFLQVKEFVDRCVKGCVAGQVKIRDGLPIAALGSQGRIDGALIYFRPESQEDAYQRISDLEPEMQYCWKPLVVGDQSANVLAGKSPDKGTEDMDRQWDGRQDPLFTAALEVVDETLNQNQKWAWDMKPLFRLEMAYLLLWTSIERYASLRYHLRDKATQKVWQIASEPAFARAVRDAVTETRSVQRADEPTRRIDLDRTAPKKAMAYYYQVRSNLVHRGKGVGRDHVRLKSSLGELLAIFRATLAAAFDESQYPVNEA